MNELFKRVLVAVFAIPAVIFLVWVGGWLLLFVLVIMSSVALWEYYRMAEARHMFPHKYPGIAIGILLQAALYYFLLNKASLATGFYVICMLIAAVMLVMILQLFSKKPNPLTNIAVTIGGVMYVPLLFSTFILIREFRLVAHQLNSLYESALYRSSFGSTALQMGSEKWAMFVLCILFSIWICDTAAYFVGKAFGRHKLYQRISPKKTWEGAVAGFIFGIISFAVFAHFLVPSFPLIHSMMVGAIAGSIGQIGDLAESQIKRDAGVKDSSTIIPGHGGFLDRFDSILFVFPAVFLYLILILIT